MSHILRCARAENVGDTFRLDRFCLPGDLMLLMDDEVEQNAHRQRCDDVDYQEDAPLEAQVLDVVLCVRQSTPYRYATCQC